jgi:hypothetical protein
MALLVAPVPRWSLYAHAMAQGEDQVGHAFISYVHEDASRVDDIRKALAAANVPVWTDTTRLSPGEDWQLVIRRAIKRGALAFVAVFSSASAARGASYQNEELLEAIEIYRKLPPGKVWLIPVRLDDCELPEYDLGAGRTLDSLHRVDLFGVDAGDEMIRLVVAVLHALDLGHADGATVRAAVTQAEGAERGAALVSVIKGMLLDPQRQLELEDLVIEEAQRVRDDVADANRFSTDFEFAGDVDGANRIADEFERYWHTIEPLCHAIAVLAAHARDEHLSLLTRVVQTVVGVAPKQLSGKKVLVEMRDYPAQVLTYAGALGAMARRNYAALKAVVVAPRTRDNHGRRGPLIARLHHAYLIRSWPVPATVLARRGDGEGTSDQEVAALISGRLGKRHTPISDHFFTVLRPVLGTLVPDEDDYDELFDETEVVLSLVAIDVREQSKDDQDGAWVAGAWFGRFTWKNHWSERVAYHRMVDDLQAQGAEGPILQSGLFGGSPERLGVAAQKFIADADHIRGNRW